MVDVLGLAPPATRTPHFGAPFECVLREMAAHKARDAGNQYAERHAVLSLVKSRKQSAGARESQAACPDASRPKALISLTSGAACSRHGPQELCAGSARGTAGTQNLRGSGTSGSGKRS